MRTSLEWNSLEHQINSVVWVGVVWVWCVGSLSRYVYVSAKRT